MQSKYIKFVAVATALTLWLFAAVMLVIAPLFGMSLWCTPFGLIMILLLSPVLDRAVEWWAIESRR